MAGAFACCCASSGKAAEPTPTPAATGTTAPPILSRRDWGAKPPLFAMTPQRITGIIIHHSGEPRNPKRTLEQKMRALQSFSQQPGRVTATHVKPAWADVPYHYYIDAGGRIAEGRDSAFAGDTNTGYATAGYVQVVVEGDFERETPDRVQLAALADLLIWLLDTWHLPNGAISVHLDHAPTDCPGRHLMEVLPEILADVAQRRALGKASE
jgi:hypothetical protein